MSLEPHGGLAGDTWAVDRPEVKTDPLSSPPGPFAGPRIQRQRIYKIGHRGSL